MNLFYGYVTNEQIDQYTVENCRNALMTGESLPSLPPGSKTSSIKGCFDLAIEILCKEQEEKERLFIIGKYDGNSFLIQLPQDIIFYILQLKREVQFPSFNTFLLTHISLNDQEQLSQNDAQVTMYERYVGDLHSCMKQLNLVLTELFK